MEAIAGDWERSGGDLRVGIHRAAEASGVAEADVASLVNAQVANKKPRPPIHTPHGGVQATQAADQASAQYLEVSGTTWSGPLPPPAILVVAACHPATVASSTVPDALTAPLRVHSDVPPRDALGSAADYLGRSGFLVVRMDSKTRLRAEREQRGGELDNTVACTTATAQAARVAVVPTMIIELAALPASAGGSELVVSSRVSAEYLRLGAAPARPRSDRDCRSTGLVERGLVERLSRGQ